MRTRLFFALFLLLSSVLHARTIEFDPSFAADPSYVPVTAERYSEFPWTPAVPLSGVLWYADIHAPAVEIPGEGLLSFYHGVPLKERNGRLHYSGSGDDGSQPEIPRYRPLHLWHFLCSFLIGVPFIAYGLQVSSYRNRSGRRPCLGGALVLAGAAAIVLFLATVTGHIF